MKFKKYEILHFLLAILIKSFILKCNKDKCKIAMNDPNSYSCGFYLNDCISISCVDIKGHCVHQVLSALDGGYCGENKICIKYKCVDATRYKEVPSSTSESSLTQQLKKSSQLLRNTCPQGASLEKQFRQRNLKATGYEELKYKGDCEKLITSSGISGICIGLIYSHVSDIVCCERCLMHQKAQWQNNCQNNPCFNGGTCIIQSGGAFKCKCGDNYYGK
jgi:hypothetical protein